MRRAQITIGRKQVSYLIAETQVPGSRQQPLRTIVLLHAFPLNAEMWHPQIGVVPPGWRMVAPDYRGFGQCAPFEMEKTRMNDLAGDVIDLLDHLEVTQAVVAGCSMGGYVALEMLESAGSYVSGLVLVDTRAAADTEEGKAGRRKMLERLEKGGSEAIADEITPKLLGAYTQRERPDLVNHLHAMIRSTNPAAIQMAIVAMMERKDMTPLLPRIKIPTLIVAGAEDALIPPATAEEMSRAIKNARLELVPFAGHLPNLEQTTPFDAALWQFLQQF